MFCLFLQDGSNEAEVDNSHDIASGAQELILACSLYLRFLGQSLARLFWGRAMLACLASPCMSVCLSEYRIYSL